MLDTGRPHWKRPLGGSFSSAYAMIIAGMWITISPYRLRDLLDWGTATTSRTQRHCRLASCLACSSPGWG